MKYCIVCGKQENSSQIEGGFCCFECGWAFQQLQELRMEIRTGYYPMTVNEKFNTQELSEFIFNAHGPHLEILVLKPTIFKEYWYTTTKPIS